MAATRRRPERRNRRSVRRLLLDSAHRAGGLGGGAVKLVRSIAKARVRTRRTGERQTRPRRSVRSRDLRQRTIQELRAQAREAGIKGRSSMTKDELIKALRGHR